RVNHCCIRRSSDSRLDYTPAQKSLKDASVIVGRSSRLEGSRKNSNAEPRSSLTFFQPWSFGQGSARLLHHFMHLRRLWLTNAAILGFILAPSSNPYFPTLLTSEKYSPFLVPPASQSSSSLPKLLPSAGQPTTVSCSVVT